MLRRRRSDQPAKRRLARIGERGRHRVADVLGQDRASDEQLRSDDERYDIEPVPYAAAHLLAWQSRLFSG
jgi:hypothetical protein